MSRQALVTGGMRGIGASVVARLRADGSAVETLDVLDGADHQVDLADPAPLPDLGAVEVLVISAAITTTIAPAHRMSDEQWGRDIAVNLTGAYRVVRACLPGMRERELGPDRRRLEPRRDAGPPRPGRLRGVEGRAARDGPDRRGRERRPRDHGQRGAAGDHRDGDGQRDAVRGARRRSRDRTVRPPRPSRGGRGARRVPRLRGRRVHHRPGPRRSPAGWDSTRPR